MSTVSRSRQKTAWTLLDILGKNFKVEPDEFFTHPPPMKPFYKVVRGLNGNILSVPPVPDHINQPIGIGLRYEGDPPTGIQSPTYAAEMQFDRSPTHSNADIEPGESDEYFTQPPPMKAFNKTIMRDLSNDITPFENVSDNMSNPIYVRSSFYPADMQSDLSPTPCDEEPEREDPDDLFTHPPSMKVFNTKIMRDLSDDILSDPAVSENINHLIGIGLCSEGDSRREVRSPIFAAEMQSDRSPMPTSSDARFEAEEQPNEIDWPDDVLALDNLFLLYFLSLTS
ncbi:hypothetical protein DPMN_166135 [Dreissena polymorpha]|uniref:Uncharacterized protein n=1 Tax=Dreissena polymorpha TaxID=45954 RepID=A0A9D4EXG2_DREPO|nr:hypothetical protein DPMN_166135 [Dreissena polymorpha]